MPSDQLEPSDEKMQQYREVPQAEKEQIQCHHYQHHHSSLIPTRRRLLIRRAGLPLLCALIIWLLYHAFLSAGCRSNLQHLRPQVYHHPTADTIEKENVTRIPLEAHIMSKCPDAKDCLQKLVVPSMVKFSDKVNFTLSYIGDIDPHSDAVSCMHGPGECLGNIIQLCAAKIYPDPKLYLGFANCMTADYEDIPDRELVENCAMEHGLDFQKLNNCISDEGEGIDLLRASVERSQLNHVRKSCTVRLAGNVRCIRDGGEWYDCPGGSSVSDLVKDVERLFGEANNKSSNNLV